ncbi:MAG: hypothetical protein JWN56_1148 [Sphingobacteriales bacterium]|nr:hypothetical protein [Sphingobacteriales bacterium]
MHFGKIVKNVAYSYDLSAEEFAEMLGHTEKHLLYLYEQKEWTSGNIKSASIALDHDFGKYFKNGFQLDFMQSDKKDDNQELILTIRYSKGKEFLLNTWLDKIAQIARAIGLEIGK